MKKNSFDSEQFPRPTLQNITVFLHVLTYVPGIQTKENIKNVKITEQENRELRMSKQRILQIKRSLKYNNGNIGKLK